MKYVLLLSLRAMICLALLLAANTAASAQKMVKKQTTVAKTGKTTPKKTYSKKISPGRSKPVKQSGKKASTPKKGQPAKQPAKRKEKPVVPLFIRGVVKSNPVSWFLMTADLAWEKVLDRHISIQLASTYTWQSGDVFDGLSAKLNGYSVSPEMRYYWTPFNKLVAPVKKKKTDLIPIAAPVSFYTAVWGKMADYKAHVEFPDHPGQKAEIFHRRIYSGGLNFGSQFWLKFKKHPVMLLDISLGGGWVEAKTETKLAEFGKRIKLKREGFSPHFGFRVGMPLR